LPEERRQRESARRGPLADWCACRDRAAPSAFIRSLPGFSAGTAARRARPDDSERAVLRGDVARDRAAFDTEERQDRKPHEQGHVALRETRRERLQVFERTAE